MEWTKDECPHFGRMLSHALECTRCSGREATIFDIPTISQDDRQEVNMFEIDDRFDTEYKVRGS